MASSVTLPTFYDEEILLYEKLNAAMDAISAKFTAGIGAADLVWPLTAEEDLDMAGYDILNVNRICNILCAGTYDDLAAVVAAASPGDVVLVPPDTTLSADSGDTFAGNGMSIVGAGPSSVIKFTGTPAGGWMIRSASGTGMRFANMTLDGDSVSDGGSGQIGLDMTGVTNLTIESINFKNFTGPCLKVSGTCSGIKVSNCAFNGGDAEHILVAKSDALEIVNCTSNDAGTTGISLSAGGATDYIDALLSNVWVNSFGTSGIIAIGVATITDASPITVQANGVVVTGAGSADSVVMGSTIGAVEYVSWQGGRVDSSGAVGMTVNARGGNINGVEIDGPATMGIDLDTSRRVIADGNIIRNATVGINGVDCTVLCKATNNIFDTCTVNIVDGEFLHHYNNEGVTGVPGSTGLSLITQPSSSYPWTGIIRTDTIPAFTLQVGDVLHVDWAVYTSASGGMGADAFHSRIDGTNLITLAAGSPDGNTYFNMGLSLIVTSTTTAHVMARYKSNESGPLPIGADEITGLDFEVDQELELYNSMDDAVSGGIVRIDYYSFRYTRSETASP